MVTIYADCPCCEEAGCNNCPTKTTFPVRFNAGTNGTIANNPGNPCPSCTSYNGTTYNLAYDHSDENIGIFDCISYWKGNGECGHWIVLSIGISGILGNNVLSVYQDSSEASLLASWNLSGNITDCDAQYTLTRPGVQQLSQCAWTLTTGTNSSITLNP